MTLTDNSITDKTTDNTTDKGDIANEREVDGRTNKVQNLSCPSHGEQLMFCFGTMTIPMRQWFNYMIPTDYVFLNPSRNLIVSPENLKSKAFTIWFYTIIDTIKNETTLKKLLDNFPDARPKEMDGHTSVIVNIFKKIASEFSIAEQLFLRDRRLQNTHGHLSQYGKKRISAYVFVKETQTVEKRSFSKDKYWELIKPLYEKMATSEKMLLEKFLASEGGREIVTYYSDNLLADEKYSELLSRLGPEVGVNMVINNGAVGDYSV